MQCNITIRKKDKGYQCIVSYKEGMKWRQKSKQGFETQKAAKLHAQEIIDNLKKTITIALDDSLKNITFIELCELYLREKTEISHNTFITYQNIVKNLSILHDMKVRYITYQTLFKTLSAGQYANRTKNMHVTFLKAVFNFATKTYKIISNNPTKELRNFTTKTYKSLTTFTNDELDLLISRYIDNPQIHALLCTARYTGARYGEIIALNWDDIDLNASMLTINKQWCRTRNGYGYTTTKTKNSIRTIPIPPVLVNVLKEYKEYSSSDRLFPYNTSSSNNINYAMRLVVPGKTIHAFRHTYATTLLANGVDIKTVASLLGDNINTVLNVYVHYSDEMRKNAADNVANIFG